MAWKHRSRTGSCTIAHFELHEAAESPNLLADSPKYAPSICLVNKSPLYMRCGRYALSPSVMVAIIESQPWVLGRFFERIAAGADAGREIVVQTVSFFLVGRLLSPGEEFYKKP
jgi:hypothetical protein